MLTPEQVISAFQSEGIGVYETAFCFDEDVDITLKSGDLKDFIRLVKENGIKSAFFGYAYVDAEDYEITDDDILDCDAVTDGREPEYEEYERRFQKEKRLFNTQIKSFDFSKPFSLCIYCILNGVQVGILQRDPWILQLPDKDELLESLEDELRERHRSAIEEERAQDTAQREEALNQIMRHLDSSDDWHACTNQRLRQIYCRNLVKEYEKQYDIQLPVYEVSAALELRWNQYKANKGK